MLRNANEKNSVFPLTKMIFDDFAFNWQNVNFYNVCYRFPASRCDDEW